VCQERAADDWINGVDVRPNASDSDADWTKVKAMTKVTMSVIRSKGSGHRSSPTHRFQRPAVTSTFASPAFSVSVPFVWNQSIVSGAWAAKKPLHSPAYFCNPALRSTPSFSAAPAWRSTRFSARSADAPLTCFVWNSFTPDLRSINTLGLFKSKPKTTVFLVAYGGERGPELSSASDSFSSTLWICMYVTTVTHTVCVKTLLVNERSALFTRDVQATWPDITSPVISADVRL